MHDPRVGRFFAPDPLARTFAHNSPYAFSENRVMDGIELEGREFSKTETFNPQTGKKDININLAFRVVKEGDLYANFESIAFQFVTAFNNLTGYDLDGNSITFSATYDPKATMNIRFVDALPNLSSTRNTPPIAIGCVPESQKGDVISGSVYVKTENASSSANPDGVKSYSGAYTALHELMVHLISGFVGGVENHTTPSELNGQNSQKTGKPLSQDEKDNNLYNSNGTPTATSVLSEAQLSNIVENITNALEFDRNNPTRNESNNTPIQGSILRTPDLQKKFKYDTP